MVGGEAQLFRFAKQRNGKFGDSINAHYIRYGFEHDLWQKMAMWQIGHKSDSPWT
jgi:hypothetical protein